MSNWTCLNSTHMGQQNVVFVTVYSVVFLVGLTLNLTALVIFLQNPKARSHTTVYMTHLAFADILLVCMLPVRIYYHAGFEISNKRLCEFTGAILLINMYGSIFLLTCISFDRCMAVCFPLSSCVQEGRKKAWYVCLGIWILTIGASVPIYFRKSGGNKENVTCFGGFPNYTTQKAVLSTTVIIGFGIPLTVMIISSWGLIRAINKSTAAQTKGLVDSKKIKRMIIMNLMIFLLCFMPYHGMLVLLYFFNKDSTKGPGSVPCSLFISYRYSLMVACLNAMLDPLAYYFTTETFKSKMDIEIVRKKWQMNSHSSDGNNRPRTPHST